MGFHRSRVRLELFGKLSFRSFVIEFMRFHRIGCSHRMRDDCVISERSGLETKTETGRERKTGLRSQCEQIGKFLDVCVYGIQNYVGHIIQIRSIQRVQRILVHSTQTYFASGANDHNWSNNMRHSFGCIPMPLPRDYGHEYITALLFRCKRTHAERERVYQINSRNWLQSALL